MTPIQMRYFYEVCRWKSISKAAAALHISQPTISISLHALESTTGLKLFRRIGKKLEITDTGIVVFNKITPLLNNLNQFDKELADMEKKKNHIRFAVPLQIGIPLLPRIWKEFKKLYSKIELEIVEVGGIEALQMVENEEVDLAITNYEGNFSHNLEYHCLFKSEACFCTYPGNKLSHKKAVSIKEIAGETLVLLNGSFFVNRVLYKTLQDNGVTPDVILHSAQLSTVKNLVVSKVASTFLMRQAITQTDAIVLIPLIDPIYINSGIIIKKGKKLYGDEKKLIAFIKQLNIKN